MGFNKELILKPDTEVTSSTNENLLIERDHFIVKTSAILSIHYEKGFVIIRIKGDGFTRAPMSRNDFITLKQEYRDKLIAITTKD